MQCLRLQNANSNHLKFTGIGLYSFHQLKSNHFIVRIFRELCTVGL